MQKLAFIALCVVGTFLSSCSKEDEPANNQTQPPTLWDLAQESPQLSLYTKAIEIAGLEAELQADDRSILAPSDSAIEAFLEDRELADLAALQQSIGPASFKQLWRYTIIKAILERNDFGQSYLPTAALNKQGDPIFMYSLRELQHISLNNSAHLSMHSQQASNGYLHFSDEVLPPATLRTLVMANPTFSIWSRILNTPGLNSSVILNQENNSYTLLAPTNTAFNNYFSQNTLAGVEGLLSYYSNNQLEQIVNYHILKGNIHAEQLNEGSYNTLNQDAQIQVARDGMLIRVSDVLQQEGSLQLTNIGAVNGSMHTLNIVLMPF